MIHEDNPFQDPVDQRDPVRRFRGRLVSPVTIATAGAGDDRTGLTVSSLIVLEGEPGQVRLVVGPVTDLWARVEKTRRFVVHVCRDDDRHVAEAFAGLRPSPGGIFAGLKTLQTEWGPVLEDLDDRVFCTLHTMETVAYSGVVAGHIDRVETGDLASPLAYFRGRYRSLS